MGRFTLSDNAKVDAKIQEDIHFIVNKILEEIDPVAIILAGSFGRGEGRVVVRGETIEPQNDYDILIVSKTKPRIPVSVLAKSLSSGVRLPVDLALKHPDRISGSPLTLLNLDLAYGAQVMWGESSVIQKFPRYEAKNLPKSEALLLLFHRVEGLLTALDSKALEIPELPNVYLSTQLFHYWVAVGQALLILNGQYDVSYKECQKRLKNLPVSSQKMAMAFDQKLGRGMPMLFTIQDFRRDLEEITNAFWLVLQTCYGLENPEPFSLLQAWEKDNTFVNFSAKVKWIIACLQNPTLAIRHRFSKQKLYAEFPKTLFSFESSIAWEKKRAQVVCDFGWVK